MASIATSLLGIRGMSWEEESERGSHPKIYEANKTRWPRRDFAAKVKRMVASQKKQADMFPKRQHASGNRCHCREAENQAMPSLIPCLVLKLVQTDPPVAMTTIEQSAVTPAGKRGQPQTGKR